MSDDDDAAFAKEREAFLQALRDDRVFVEKNGDIYLPDPEFSKKRTPRLLKAGLESGDGWREKVAERVRQKLGFTEEEIRDPRSRKRSG